MTSSDGNGHTQSDHVVAQEDHLAPQIPESLPPKSPPEIVPLQEGDKETSGETGPHQLHNMESALSGGTHEQLPTEGALDSEIVFDSDEYSSTALDIDPDQSDADSALGGSLQSSMMSARSSVYDAVRENGRTYHAYKQGTYYLPNDEVEQERLDLQHQLFYETLNGRLSLAPIKNPHNVLDIGTGTGVWAMDFATQNPASVVIGSDLSPIQPHYVPPNCQFEVDDAEDVWVYNRKFDYIHGRALFSCFQNPAAVFQKAFDNLIPGGYFEMQDVFFKPHSNDGTIDGTPFAKWNETVVMGAKKLNRDWHCVQHYKRWFEEVGFQDVVERRFYWPMNPWAKGEKMKTIGLWSMQNSLEGVSSISLAIMTRVLGRSPTEVEAELEEVRQNIKDHTIHSYWPVYVVYGRKPL